MTTVFKGGSLEIWCYFQFCWHNFVLYFVPWPNLCPSTVQVKSFSKNFCKNLASSVFYVDCSCRERLQCKSKRGLLNLFNVNSSKWQELWHWHGIPWKIFLNDRTDNVDANDENTNILPAVSPLAQWYYQTMVFLEKLTKRTPADVLPVCLMLMMS